MKVETHPRPDPTPAKPKFTLPEGAVDCHFHLFGPASKYRFVGDSPYHADDALIEDYIHLQDHLGLARAVFVNAGGYGRNPQLLLDTLAAYPKRFRGVIVPADDLSAEQIEPMHHLGVRGVRFMSKGRGSHVAPLLPEVAARIAEFGWHVQFYPFGTDIVDYAPELLKLKNPVILDHFAAVPASEGTNSPAFRKVLELLDTGRFWVKLSGPMRCTSENPPYPSMTAFARVLVAHAPERLVWGSDWPHANMTLDKKMPNDGELVDCLLDWVPDEGTRKLILVDNPWSFYGFEA